MAGSVPAAMIAKERRRCHNSNPVFRTYRHPLPARALSDCKNAQIAGSSPWPVIVAVRRSDTADARRDKLLRSMASHPSKSTRTAQWRAPAGRLGRFVGGLWAIQPKLATDPNALAPPSATKSWSPEGATRIPSGKATLDAFAAPTQPSPAAIQPGLVYDLPNPVDLAQQTTPRSVRRGKQHAPPPPGSGLRRATTYRRSPRLAW